MILRLSLAATLLASSAPAFAQANDPLAPLPPGQQQRLPEGAQLPDVEASWSGVFAAIDREQWDVVRAMLFKLDTRHPLHPVAEAEFYLAANSPRVSKEPLEALLVRAPELPQASQLARLAQRRGADAMPVVATRGLRTLGSAPRRQRGRSSDDPVAVRLREEMTSFVDADDGISAEALYRAAVDEGSLVGEGRAEIAQRVAWIHYVRGAYADARRVAAEGAAYGQSEWKARSAWIEALASWRLNDCRTAGDAFRLAALGTSDRELAAAGHYWSARAAQACGNPHEVQSRLRAAAANEESFYGIVARETLGMALKPAQRVETPSARDLERVAQLPNIARAIALVEIGRRSLAEEYLKHQAAIGDPRQHKALVEIAKRLDLGGAQYWLATNGQPGASVDLADRYPAPGWTPDNGWRLDPYIAYAHVIQESDFRPRVVSPADAVGLMQVRPGTARDTARSRGQTVTADDLKRPETNLDHGQAFIELMRREPATRDELFRVTASYNAGLVPVTRWQSIADGGDPLLWMESLPYWETRFYIPSVLRNYFVYHALAGNRPPALKDVVEHRAPKYPTRR
ncbi:lytic transglycosylase domain-containing protein [Sphingomicrobium nitratireducens]|uniref:lytic transglycosylase domain-containing protein n=1 Tax=Sphingomicrobium nitratireducens TaxID=2964666 RepID=UPI002240D662|nr:lytic transglycosylase domain-containing protein [Sphingomicrobium nitratireducens]